MTSPGKKFWTAERTHTFHTGDSDYFTYTVDPPLHDQVEVTVSAYRYLGTHYQAHTLTISDGRMDVKLYEESLQVDSPDAFMESIGYKVLT